MRSTTLIICLLFNIICLSQDPLPPIGQWREHLPYNSAIDLCAGNGKIFAATPFSLFSAELVDGSIERFSRVTGLSETGVSAIYYDSIEKQLLIAYTNSNLDIIEKNKIVNIPDIKRDNIIGDKTIYNIYKTGSVYYLCTGLGIVLIDAKRKELKDSWFIGNGGNQLRINGFTSDASYYYAATADGLKKAAINSSNLADPANWNLINGNGLSFGSCQQVITIQNKIIVQKNDSLFMLNGNSWNYFYSDGWPFVSVNLTENRISICERNGTNARVIFLNADASIYRNLNSTGAISFPRKAITYHNEPWVADQFAGLSDFNNGNNYVSYSPNSPQAIGSGEMIVNQSKLYVSSGAVNNSWNYQYDGDGLFVFGEGSWNNINRYRYSVMDSLLDLVCITFDNRDNSIWAGSFGGGLLHIKQGPVFKIFKQGKLEAPVGDPGSYRVAGLAFDKEQNLWISNFGSAQPLKVIKSDGNWKNLAPPFSLVENAMSQILIDDNNYKWIVSPLGNGLLCFDDAGSIDNTGDDRWRRYRSGAGNGNLPGTEVICIAKDRNGYIWAGTNNGVGVIECPDQAFTAGGCDAIWPVVANGNFTGYLFKGQEVRSIAVDGANRKWIATQNGVFLVDPTGEKLIYRFTEDNSPLLSNDVKKLAIDGVTGELFIETAKGLCSFRSTATEPAENSRDLLVFPNPVPPGYTGTIAIKGLAENSIVKITELNGRLVYQTRVLGGQAIWDGKNYNGQKIASGAYLVLVGKEGSKISVAGKIFFISN